MATHDLTKKEFGNDYAFTGIYGNKARMTVWSGKRIEEGDFLIVRNGDGTTRYQVDNVKRMTDPPDQMFLDVTFAPRSPEPEEVAEPEQPLAPMRKDKLAEFSRQFLALDRARLDEWMRSVIAMHKEYVEVHGYTEETAETAAIQEVIGGTEAIVDLYEHGEL